ncbi:hypothetical protein [uncultured Tateyamaria sp.]|uniref:hypothetical protein n=1 Tax=uncultured Tateyamaria sp. TaxID=455651 RepID=UPI0026278941|nr:hypothetical protein [uncultured Tateyamaria sp.]
MEADKRRLILHAGMHKTGSTSIQHWLRNTAFEDAHYFKWRQSNHSNLFVLLFEDNPHEYLGLKRSGLTQESAEELRVEQRKRMIQQINNNDKSTFVFSAERISSAPRSAVQRMNTFFSQYFNDIQVYAYVRRPAGFMTSMFQQHLKTGSVQLNTKQLWPDYKGRFARLDEIFGQDSVRLRLYEDLQARNTDAVTDFGNWIGLPPSIDTEVRRNQSMRSSAVALLYLYRKYAAEMLTEKQRKDRDKFVVHNLWQIEGQPFSFKPVTGDLLKDQKLQDDMGWMASRLNIDINDLDQDIGARVVFSCEDDLVREAIQSSHLMFPQGSTPQLDPDTTGAREEAIRRVAQFSELGQ